MSSFVLYFYDLESSQNLQELLFCSSFNYRNPFSCCSSFLVSFIEAMLLLCSAIYGTLIYITRNWTVFMTTKILYFHIFLIFCGWEACVTRSEHLRGAKDKVKRPKGGLTRSWGPYIPNFFNFHPTLTANNSGLKPSKLKNYHIFGMPRTSAFSWYTPFRSYI